MKTIRTGELHVRPRWQMRDQHRVDPYGGTAAKAQVAVLYLVSRRYAQTLVAIAGLAALNWWVMEQTPTKSAAGMDVTQLTARNETLLVHLSAAMLASVIGVAVWTPFGETERVSQIVLPVMRALHLLSMLVIGCAAIILVISGWGDVIPGVSLVPLFVRNTLFLTGCVLLIGRVVDIHLSWLLPVMFGGVTIVGLLQRMARIDRVEELWQGPPYWNLLALDGSYGIANAVCLGVGIAAIAIYIRDGVRDTDEAE